MCVSGYMEFQNRDSRYFLIFCSKFLHRNNRETICQNGKNLMESSENTKKNRWHSRVT